MGMGELSGIGVIIGGLAINAVGGPEFELEIILAIAERFALRDIGWNDPLVSAFADFAEENLWEGEREGLYLARIAHEHRLGYRVSCQAVSRRDLERMISVFAVARLGTPALSTTATG